MEEDLLVEALACFVFVRSGAEGEGREESFEWAGPLVSFPLFKSESSDTRRGPRDERLFQLALNESKLTILRVLRGTEVGESVGSAIEVMVVRDSGHVELAFL